MKNIDKPAWLETLWNVNSRLAEAAEKDVVRWQKLETSHDKALNLADVTNSALKIEPIDTTISPQIQQFLDDMQKANEELSKAATTYLMIPAKYFGK